MTRTLALMRYQKWNNKILTMNHFSYHCIYPLSFNHIMRYLTDYGQFYVEQSDQVLYWIEDVSAIARTTDDNGQIMLPNA